MGGRRHRRTSLAERVLDLAWSSPYVIAHRLRKSDGSERSRMVVEKLAAGFESWNAVAAYSLALQGAFLREMLRHRTWNGFAAGAPLLAWVSFMRRAERGMSDATAPFHRRATANARRFSAKARSIRRR